MPRPSLISSAFRDHVDDIAHHAVNLTHGVFDLVCMLALGLVVFASSFDTASLDAGNAGLTGRPLFAVQASQSPSSCSLTNDLLPAAHRSCITAMVLEPIGT